MKSICFKKNTLITIEQLVCFFFRALIRGVKKMKSIQIIDALGRLLWSKENINSNELTLNDFTSNSILLISIELTDNQKISKKYSN